MDGTFDIGAARRSLAERRARREKALDARFAEARRDAAAIVALIADKYHPRRIYQWGSLLNRRHFWEKSDIDVALEGLRTATDVFPLMADAEKLTKFPLHIVDLDRTASEFAGIIRKRGRVVHGQPG